MQVIDKREGLTVTFGDLAIGDAFQDEDGDISIKTDVGSAIYWTGNRWAPSFVYVGEEPVVPLEATYTFKRKEGKNEE